ncbi:hypothetical protein BDE02_18G124200 [Populus trichocarpa]|nr:hypothetical protein BDE02_18G124200 [Populus trichocarpa]
MFLHCLIVLFHHQPQQKSLPFKFSVLPFIHFLFLTYFLNHFSLSVFSLIPDWLSKTVLIKNLKNRF